MAKTVLVTGTSTGIGRACVVRMAAEGWTVYAGVRKDADGEAVAAAVRGDVRPVLLDVTDAEHIAAVAERLQAELDGRGLDGLVNNAGVAEGGPIETLTAEAWRWHFDVNLFGVVDLTRACFPLLREARGRVVNVGSVAGRAAAPMLAPYAAGKHAVEAFSESLRFEVEHLGMRVSCVEPGEIRTAIWDKADEQLARVVATMDEEVQRRYEGQLDMIYGFVADGAKRGIPASKVANAIHHALSADRPKHRYLVGPDAKALGVIARLPDRARHRALALNTARWSRMGRKVRRR
jgi:NAD(P)-dependent dehydrogenase (short-subunit alcohol dehydrogenase family)